MHKLRCGDFWRKTVTFLHTCVCHWQKIDAASKPSSPPPSYTRPYDDKSKLFFLVWLNCQQTSLTGAEEKAFVTIEISKERISAICMYSDVVADTKGSFCQCQGTPSNYGPLLHIVESMVLHKIGVVGPTIDEQYNRVSQHFPTVVNESNLLRIQTRKLGCFVLHFAKC